MKTSKKVSISDKYSFICYYTIMGIVFTVSLIFSVLDRVYLLINWPVNYEDTIGVVLQIITTIITMVISLIGISISLQNESIFGCKLTALYALRKQKHYSFLQIFIISILLCTFNIIFYMLNLKVAVIGTSITSLLFLFQIVHLEFPIMVKAEESVTQIIKDNFIFYYLCGAEIPKTIKDAVRYLLYTDNFKKTFDFFRIDSDQEYNKYILLKLLEFQRDLAGDLEIKYDLHDQLVIGDSLLDNTLDILLNPSIIPDNIYCTVEENKCLLISILLHIHKLSILQEKFSTGIKKLFACLHPTNTNHIQSNLIADIIIILAAETIKNEDTSIFESLRLQLSACDYMLQDSSYTLDVFALLSMYLYYLSCSEPLVPNNIRQTIKSWINEKGKMKQKTRISSWSSLFSLVAKKFDVNYKRFSAFATRNSGTLDYFPFGIGAKQVIFQPSYVAFWYLTNWLNTEYYSNCFDPSVLLNNYPELKKDLKDFGTRCFNESQSFTPTLEMNKIIDFYSDDTDCFAHFELKERQDHCFFNFINQLNYDELLNNTKLAVDLDQEKLANRIKNAITTALTNKWGFNLHQGNCKKEYSFSFIMEKKPEAINFEETIIHWCKDSVLNELKDSIKKTVIYTNNEFDKNINNILLMAPQYATKGTCDIIAHYIKDDELKNKFIQFFDKCNTIDNSIFDKPTIVINENDFWFNCDILKVEFRDLSEEELYNKVKNCQRADGQFVFEGVFLPQEKIAQIVKKKYHVLNLIFNYQVFSLDKNIFEIDFSLKK